MFDSMKNDKGKIITLIGMAVMLIAVAVKAATSSMIAAAAIPTSRRTETAKTAQASTRILRPTPTPQQSRARLPTLTHRQSRARIPTQTIMRTTTDRYPQALRNTAI